MALQLSNGHQLSLDGALRSERNMLHRLRTANRKVDMRKYIWSQRRTIESICARHFSLPTTRCVVQHPKTWLCGQFNLCVTIHVTHPDGGIAKKFFRCPLPHKVGEERRSGAMDEKIRVEVANYAFVQANCTDVPIPYLAGFGFSDNRQFTHERHVHWLRRCYNRIRRLFYAITRPSKIISAYLQTSSTGTLGLPYMLLDCAEGEMLSATWHISREDPVKRETLFRGLSRVMLSLARLPQPQIGCLRFHDDGAITLANPPLLCADLLLESEGEGTPRSLDAPLSSTGAFLSGLLSFRDSVFRAQPNAAVDEEDCRLQMAHMFLLRALAPRLVDEHYHGPFVLQCTDLHASNVFVDDDWNVVGIIDLEFMCALPPSMLSVPYWISVSAIDLIGENADRHRAGQEEFLEIFEAEENQQLHLHSVNLCDAIRSAWDSGAYWVYMALISIDGLPCAMEDHIWARFGFQPLLSRSTNFTEDLSHFWSEDSEAVVKQKVHDKAHYDKELQAHYEASGI